MNFELVLKELLLKFKEQNVRYALIGGFAMQVTGFTRATDDVDFLVEAQDIDKIRKIMQKFGYELTHESQNFSNYWHPMAPMGCVDYLYTHRDYGREMLQRAKNHKILGNIEVPILLPEDIIGLKVQALVNNPQRRALDMADIEYLIKNNLDKLDMKLVKKYFDLFKMNKELENLLKKTKDA